jgi:hypothetical protein
MKLDAHCAVDKGFDVKLAADCEYSWTVIPRMYCLDAQEFIKENGESKPNPNFWKPKLNKATDYMYISSPQSDQPFRAKYYEHGVQKPRSDALIDDTMACMGPGWFMHRDRFLEQDGCDEGHGGWGAMSVEVAMKAWMSGGALKVNKKTWFAHWFRTGGIGFPYSISGRDQEKAREYSRNLWLNDAWPLATRKLQWLVDKFNPPGWKENDLTLLYYTANVIHPAIEYSVLRSLRKYGYPIVSVSQKPMDLGCNIVVEKERSLVNVYRQVLIAAKEAKTKYVALCEDDCLYVPEHFTYRPKKAFGYNLNRWLLHLPKDERCFSYRRRPILSQCIANREALVEVLEGRFKSESPIHSEMGMEDGADYETFETKLPNLVICHNRNTSGRKYIGKDAEPRQELEPWGTVDYWIDKFEKRGYYKGQVEMVEERAGCAKWVMQ